MATLSGEKILLTGPAGQIAFPLARALARDNEVWGLARFGNPGDRSRVEALGLRTLAVDLAEPDFSGVPDDFDLVLHLAAAISPGLSDHEAICINAEGTGHLMAHVRRARACLVMSTTSIYADSEDPHHVFHESDPLGAGVRPEFAPGYRVSKLSQEAVARYACIAHGLPTTIANWGGDEPVDLREVCRYIGELVGREAVFVESAAAYPHTALDAALRTQLAGPCKVPWRDGIRRMVAARHPEIALRDA